MCYDAVSLYILWLLYEAEMDQHLPGKPPDSRYVIDEREYLLLHLDPGCTRKHWYSFEANDLGAQQDANIHHGYAFDCEWEVKSSRFGKGWTVETAVPFAALVQGELRGTPQVAER